MGENEKMNKVKNSINIWKNKLLDTTKRNKAVNFKPTKLSSLRIIQPNIFVFLISSFEELVKELFDYVSWHNNLIMCGIVRGDGPD